MPDTEIVHADNPTTLIRLAVESGADPDRLGKLMALQERWEANQAKRAFADALAAFQAECPVIRKTRSASFKGSEAYRYASLEDVMQTIRPILHRHGLSVAFSAECPEPGIVRVECIVRHGTHEQVTTCTLPVPAEMRVNHTQKMGAALSYAKRYALCMALNIQVADEDNDAANLAGETVTEEQAITLQELCDGLPKGTFDKMLAWLGVPSVYDVPAKRFNECKAMLIAKRQKAGLA